MLFRSRDRTKHQVAEVTSLGLVQMTRKRVGQGLIEAFSTTCESCGGRGIHVHMEPVNKKSLDRESAPSEKDEREGREERESKQEKAEIQAEEPAPSTADESEKPRFGRRKRRAATSGVLTPGGSV